jgi:hypothetical protein
MPGSPHHQQKFICAIDRMLAARFALVAAGVGLAAALFIAAGQAKARIVQCRHVAFDSLGNAIDRNIGVELQQTKTFRIELGAH